MKDKLTDANFPRTADGRVYHLGLKAGEVANRLITVGTPSRAEAIAAHFDAAPSTFRLMSERGFLTLTGRYHGVPVSVVAIGMGYPNVDFFIREVRESVSGDMIVIRLGSCGCLRDYPVGSVVVPKASVGITRNYDYDFISSAKENGDIKPYIISKPIPGDSELYSALVSTLQNQCPEDAPGPVIGDVINASADSFYSSQGRQTSFPDQNEDLIQLLLTTVPDLATLEMETTHIFHLAASYKKSPIIHPPPEPPLTTGPVVPSASGVSHQDVSAATLDVGSPIIRAAAAHMVFASRGSGGFITPEQVATVEGWATRGVLEAITSFTAQNVHQEEGSVWELA